MLEINIKKKIADFYIEAKLSFPDKGLYYICGESGCGKTTLFNILASFDKKYEGYVKLDNKDIKKIKKYQNYYSYLNQRNCLFMNKSVIANITYIGHMFNASDDDIDKYLDMLSLSSLKGEICCNLSNGEMRRLMLAMSLIKDSPILLLDEPFAGLDIDNIKIINDVLNELKKDKLIIASNHISDINGENVIAFNGHRIENNKEISNDKIREKNYKSKITLSKSFLTFSFIYIFLLFVAGTILAYSENNQIKMNYQDAKTNRLIYRSNYIEGMNNDNYLNLTTTNNVVALKKIDFYSINFMQMEKDNLNSDFSYKQDPYNICCRYYYKLNDVSLDVKYGHDAASDDEIVISDYYASLLTEYYNVNDISELIGKKLTILYSGSKNDVDSYKSYEFKVSGILETRYQMFIEENTKIKQNIENFNIDYYLIKQFLFTIFPYSFINSKNKLNTYINSNWTYDCAYYFVTKDSKIDFFRYLNEHDTIKRNFGIISNMNVSLLTSESLKLVEHSIKIIDVSNNYRLIIVGLIMLMYSLIYLLYLRVDLMSYKMSLYYGIDIKRKIKINYLIQIIGFGLSIIFTLIYQRYLNGGNNHITKMMNFFSYKSVIFLFILFVIEGIINFIYFRRINKNIKYIGE